MLTNSSSPGFQIHPTLAPAGYSTAPESTPLFGTKANLELWTAVEHMTSYGLGNVLGANASYKYRVANPDLREICLYNPEHPIGAATTSTLIRPEFVDHLDETETQHELIESANIWNAWSQGIKILFQLPNTGFNFVSAYKNISHPEGNVYLMNYLGKSIRSLGNFAEKGSILVGLKLYNENYTVIPLTSNIHIDALNLLVAGHAINIVSSLLFTPLSLPYIIKEGKKEAGIGGMFMDSLNAIGASLNNLLMSGATLYFFWEASDGSLQERFGILNQSFAFKGVLLISATTLAVLLSGFSLKGHINRYQKARLENDRERQNITIPLIASAVCSITAAPFTANPAYAPVGGTFMTLASLFLASSMVYKHRNYIREYLKI